MERIPVTIVTGFLGAGKTTLLNRLMKQPGFSDTAVIVNEFGEADIDGALVNRVEDRAFASTTGCLCCTVSGDVRFTLLRLLDEADRGVGPMFSRVVVETTGLADPGPILRTFMSTDSMLNRFTINGVVTLVDAIYGSDVMERFQEAQRQIAVADLILVTKGDLAHDPASRRDLLDLKNQLRHDNPGATVLPAEDAAAEMLFSYAAFDASGKPPDVRQWLRFEPDEAADHKHGHHHHHHKHDVNRHGDTASAFCFSASSPINTSALENAVSALQTSLGRDLLRMKGLIEIAEHPSSPRVLHVVGHVASAPRHLESWPDGLNRTRLVMIVAGSGREEAAALLKRSVPELVPYASAVSEVAV